MLNTRRATGLLSIKKNGLVKETCLLPSWCDP
jgi:hypothetical protein